ncbi:MAG TPA: DUF2062 domain-containing protein, partial [Chromatiales bacterium]|nr:DUF2062 domain-containing protein [Chromatiales bacterium]
MPRRFFRRISAGYFRNREYPWYMRPFEALLRHPVFFSVSRRSVAGAIWLGLFIALLPLPGQTILAILLAMLLRVNLPIAAIMVWITNPVTMVPVFYSEYRIGAMLLGLPVQNIAIEPSWQWLREGFQLIWKPLLLGSFITATIVASVAYVVVSITWRLVVMI